MSAITSKVQVCNMAISHLGNYGTIANIDTPKTDKEITFALWFDISRQTFLKMTMPNFSLFRDVVAQVVTPPPFGTALGYQHAYEYPNNCLKVLGIGEIKDKENNYVVEGNLIWTNCYYPDGLPLRYLKDVQDITLWSPETVIGFSWFLAGNVAMDITQDLNKVKFIEDVLPSKMSTLSGLNAQENPPMRISHSRFKEARFTGFPRTVSKR